MRWVIVQSLSCVSSLQITWTEAHQAPLPSTISIISWNSCSLSWWFYLTILSSATHFSFCHQTFLASRSFPVSQLFASGGQSIGALASATVLPMNIQDRFPWLTGLISLQSKGLSRIFSSTIIWKQFFGTQPSLQSNSHILTWLLKP